MTVEIQDSHGLNRVTVVLAILFTLLLPLAGSARAQEAPDEGSFVGNVVGDVVKDPTTYIPAAMLYTAMRLDWASSQQFFERGFLEENARYTVSGLPKDQALTYADGNARILKDSLAVLPASFANNLLTHFAERRLGDRFPEHRKIWKALSWVERTAFAAFVSYRLAGPHFAQWRKNERLARQYGFVQQ